MSGSARRHDSFGALDEVRQTLGASTLGGRACNDLDGAILMASLVPDYSNPRASAFANGLAKLPRTDVDLSSPAGGVRGSRRYGRIAFRVSIVLASYLRDTLVFR